MFIRVREWLRFRSSFVLYVLFEINSVMLPKLLVRNFHESIACKHCLHYNSSMHATVYGRGQMVIPARARKEAGIDTGDVVNVLPEGDGRLVLVRMERPKPKPRNKVRIIRRKGKHSLLSIGRPISREEVFKALEQFPP